MIRSFRDERSRMLFEGRRMKDFRSGERQAIRRLQILDDAETLIDLAGLPSNRLEALSGDRRGQYGIRVNRQWRICFEWRGKDAFSVEITDYH